MLSSRGFTLTQKPEIKIDNFTVGKVNSASLQMAHTTGSASLAIAVTNARNEESLPTLTWGGVEMSVLTYVADYNTIAVHYLFSPPSGATTVTTTMAEGTVYLTTFRNAGNIEIAESITTASNYSIELDTPFQEDGLYVCYATQRNSQGFSISGTSATTLANNNGAISSIFGAGKGSLSVSNTVGYSFLAGAALLTPS